MKEQQYDLEERLLEYAANVIRLVERLPGTRAGNHIAGQLLRCGTSPLPNHGEAQAAESRNDFVHKFSICLKELRESRRWLRLARRVPLLKPPAAFDPLLEERSIDQNIRDQHPHGAAQRRCFFPGQQSYGKGAWPRSFFER